MDLFLDQAQNFAKEAAFAARLSETPDNWPQELTSELFKQLPFLSDYDVNVVMDRIEKKKGMGFGFADVTNKTERPEIEHAEAGIPHIRIPLVIQERAVKPFSVFLDGERVLPLTEERVREILFNPATFDLSATPPRDPSLVETLMPPQRQGIGMGGEYKMASAEERFIGEMSKTASGMRVMEKYIGDGGLQDIVDMWMERDVSAWTPRKKDPEELQEKVAYAEEACSPKMSSLDGPEGWLKQFEGTPLMGRALQLESDHLKHQVEQNHKDQERSARMEATRRKDDKARKADDEFYRRGDSIRTGRRGLELELALHRHEKLMSAGKTKESAAELEFIKLGFGHISKDQWKAIYQSKEVQKAIHKAGNPADRQVTNTAYQLASKHYGFFPKIPEMNKEDLQNMKLEAQKKSMEKQQKSMQKKKTASLLMAIAPTLRETDVERFTEKVASDPTLIAGFRRNGIAPVLVEALENTKRASAGDRLEALADAIEPTVVTLQKLPGGDFLVKSAARNAFADGEATRGQVVPEPEAAEAVGPELAQGMQPGQTATAVADPAEAVEPEPTKAKVIEEFGQYQVQDTMGNSLVGHVFPHVLAWDDSFSEQPICLFTNGSAYAFQESIAGEMVGKGSKMPSDAPRGDGVFYTVKDGEGICTSPITIGSSAAGPDGLPRFIGTDAFGQQIQVSQSEGLREPARVSDAEYAVPADWKFMRLNNQTQLIPDPLQMNKQAEARAAKSTVTLFYNGGFNLQGGCGLDKVSSDLRFDMDPVHAEFMLGLLGVEGGLAKVKLAEALKRGSIKIAGLHSIQLLAERYAQSEKTASVLLDRMPELRRDLIKEASELEDENTVDNLLALNFINPENLSTFVSYMPELESCSEKLAEMLLFSYVGEKSLPEGAIDRSMKNLEEVITGLKAVAHAEG